MIYKNYFIFLFIIFIYKEKIYLIEIFLNFHYILDNHKELESKPDNLTFNIRPKLRATFEKKITIKIIDNILIILIILIY